MENAHRMSSEVGCDSILEPISQEYRDWASGLPTEVLVQVFDQIITCPSAHPSYLRQKAQWYQTLRLTCKSWRHATNETAIGVCVPAKLSKPARDFVCSVMLRGIEFHAPEHTDEEVVGMLADPRMLARSGKSLQSIIDAPFNGKWKPSDFENLNQLVIFQSGKTSRIWDVTTISSLKHLSYLVLAGGFTSLKNMGKWPVNCKHFVWTNPCDTQNSLLRLPSLPPHVNFHWVSIRAYAVSVPDPESLLGRTQQFTVHAAYIGFRIPPRHYCTGSSQRSTASASSSLNNMTAAGAATLATQGVAALFSPAENGVMARPPRGDDDWAQKGLQGIASMLVSEHSLTSIRLKFSLVMISPVPGGDDTMRFAQHNTSTSTRNDNVHNSDDDSVSWETVSEGEDDIGSEHGSDVDHFYDASAGSSSAVGQSSTSQPESTPDNAQCRRCGKKDKGSGDPDDDAVKDAYLEFDHCEQFTYEQVSNTFQKAIKEYEESVSERSMKFSQDGADNVLVAGAFPVGPPKPAPMALACDLGGDCGVQSVPPPPPYIIPVLEKGKAHGSIERELSITRKWADPREPARLKLDQPNGPDSMTFDHQGPLIINTKRAVQSLAFSSWPYSQLYKDRLEAGLRKQRATAAAAGPTSSGSDGECKHEEAQSTEAQQAESGSEEQQQQEVEQREEKEQQLSSPSSSQNTANQGSAEEAASVKTASSDEHHNENASTSDANDLAAASSSSRKTAFYGSISDEELVQYSSDKQCQFLTDPRVTTISGNTLRKINFLLLTSTMTASYAQSLLAPFKQLTKISVVVMQDCSTYTTPIFPITVVKVAFYATKPRQRFHSGILSNLTELWRIILSGFYSFDLSHVPHLRPGFILKIADVPAERTVPIGDPSLDTMLPPHIMDVSVQIGTDQALPPLPPLPPGGRHNFASVPKLPLTLVDLSVWGSHVRTMHIRSPSGVELYAPGHTSLHKLFKSLKDGPLEQVTVSVTLDEVGAIALQVPPPGSPEAQSMTGRPPVFAFVLGRSQRRYHGMSVAGLLKTNMIPGWDLEVSPGGIVDSEEDMMYITFFKSNGQSSQSSGHAGNAAAVDPLTAALQSLQAGGGGAGGGADGDGEDPVAVALAAVQALSLAAGVQTNFHFTDPEDPEDGSFPMMDELD